MPPTARVALFGLLAVLATSRAAHAEGDFDWHLPERSYLWDGGAVPFLYLPIAIDVGLHLYPEPPHEPRWFGKREGGKPYRGEQYPSYLLYTAAAVTGGIILIGGDDSRWYHVKGFAQSIAVTKVLTTAAKLTFGRHRPGFDLRPGAVNPPDARKSFWSGHASMTLATATYLGIYARRHLFDRWRPAGTVAWWEGAAYAGLAAGAFAIPYSQYWLGRHHASDVITGGLVGALVSTVFYLYQEDRYRDAREAGELAGPAPLSLSIGGAW